MKDGEMYRGCKRNLLGISLMVLLFPWEDREKKGYRGWEGPMKDYGMYRGVKKLTGGFPLLFFFFLWKIERKRDGMPRVGRAGPYPKGFFQGAFGHASNPRLDNFCARRPTP